jgi:hypothetical protein
MKVKMAVVSIVTSLAVVAVAPPAHAEVQDPISHLIGTLAAGMGLTCNTLTTLGLPLCHQ